MRSQIPRTIRSFASARISTGEDASLMAEPVVTVNGLARRFGQVAALDGVDFEAAAGTSIGLLGPNGQARRPRCKR